MVYCGRCGNSGHYISSCPEIYNRDGKRISKFTDSKTKSQPGVKNHGQYWSRDDDVSISEDLDDYIKKKSRELGRTENAIYARLIKILDEMGK